MISQLVSFLEGSGTDSRSRRLADIWRFDADEIDTTLDFIQWMFPLNESSSSNFNAPVLLASEIDEIRSSMICQQNLVSSAAWILSFFQQTNLIFQYTNHNNLRVTRIVKSLRLLYSDRAADQFKDELLVLIETRRARINPVTMEFWLAS